ncbi:NAD-dependent epimerase/dehydratase family protein [Salsipaludibacter albus]|uniref:NAD-dependent epimerase/dehydratase family protein n=1 Tax=Salsipaludibacter albus TaxID=2849650 RepID=UPI001EE46B66|nr:NAD-dependent epimerase/dehydratase family protein [Salsipaludibacter albus]MBY5162186.1 NAD-dependent epimerase/dehydratase family protein [Salsipaludibacter albus]
MTTQILDVTVLGATGGIGRAISRELADRGHRVTGASRSGGPVGDDVASTTVDLTDRAAAIAACRGADVVVMAAQPPYQDWLEHFPPLLDNVLAAAEEADARLVFVDNLYMYAPAAGPLAEDSPEHATDHKGMLRRRLGETVLAAHESGRVRATIGRFSDYYGPEGTNSGLYMVGIAPGLAGRRPRGLFQLDQPHTFHYLPDAARGFATLVEDDRADGSAWILPAAPATTQRELLQLVADETSGKRPGVVPGWALWLAGLFDPMLRESRSVVVQYDRPWVVDASRFDTTFGSIDMTPHRVAVAETVAAFRDTSADGSSSDASDASHAHARARNSA